MNPLDILRYGHSFVLRTLEDFPREELETPGAVGYWSVKDVMSHLSSYELALVEVLRNVLDPTCPTPLVDEMSRDGQAFNDHQVDVIRKGMPVASVLSEYETAFNRVMELARQVPVEAWRRNGILAWYGAEYDLEDFIVYSYYGHKREHCGQIQTFRDRVK